MQIDKLIKIEDAPSTGYILAYTRKQKPVFRKYCSIEQIKSEYADEELLEIHLFNDNKEYRAISSTSNKNKNGFIECIVTDSMYKILRDESGNALSKGSSYEVYEEITKLDEPFETTGWLKVCNYIEFNDRGMSKIIDYRLIYKGDK